MACRYILVGDGQSPHLLKWVRTLHAMAGPALELGVVSSRGLLPGIEALIPPERRLLLHTEPRQSGGNAAVLRHLPRVAIWLRAQQPQVLHAHYLTSHGALAWLSQMLWRVPGTLVSSAWGSDILVTANRSRGLRLLTSAVLRASAVCTADSRHMASEMLRLGAREVSVFPFGLDQLPPAPAPGHKDPYLFFSNRALEPLYRIDRVIELFAAVANAVPQAQLVVAHEGSQAAALRAQVAVLGLASRVTFKGRLSAEEQAGWYARAQWHLSLPRSDSASVSVLEAMAYGCIPVLSDLPANRELVTHTLTGWVMLEGNPWGRPPSGSDAAAGQFLGTGAAEGEPDPEAYWEASRAAFLAAMPELLARALEIAQSNRDWVQRHGLFPRQVRRFLCDVLPPASVALIPPASP